MKITLLTISKQCSEVINTCAIEIELYFSTLNDLYDQIYDIYPTLDQSQYSLYWSYNNELFYLISNYLTYMTVLTLMVDTTIYLLLDDCDEHCEENEGFIKRLDLQELKEKIERERDIYDVKIKRPGEESETESIPDEVLTEPRPASQIITYAIKNHPKANFYTSDLVFKYNLGASLSKGWFKPKPLTLLGEEVIDRIRPGKKKGKDKGKKK